MKKIIIITGIVVIALFSNMSAIAQMRGPNDPGGDPTGNPPLGGGAPIGSGTLILIGLGAAYAGKKIYNLKTEEKE